MPTGRKGKEGRGRKRWDGGEGKEGRGRKGGEDKLERC